MRCNVQGLLTNVAQAIRLRDARGYGFALEELVRNLKELRDRTRAGDMAAVDEFFTLYVFEDGED